MFSRVLAPLDGSPAATERLRDIGALCKFFDAELVLLTVIDARQSDTMIVDLPTGPVNRRGEVINPEALDRRAQIYLDRALVVLSRAGIEVSSQQADGDADTAILRVARELDCDLIALSPTTHQTTRRIGVGSITERLLHSAPIPVMAVKEGSEALFSLAKGEMTEAGRKKTGVGSVLVPLDGSKDAEAALNFASALAANIGAGITLATVAPSTLEVGEAGELETRDIREDITRYLDGLAHFAAEQGAQVDYEIAIGDAAVEFNKIADSLQDPIVVISTRRRSSASNRLIGSFTDRIVRRLNHPIIAVPRDS